MAADAQDALRAAVINDLVSSDLDAATLAALFLELEKRRSGGGQQPSMGLGSQGDGLSGLIQALTAGASDQGSGADASSVTAGNASGTMALQPSQGQAVQQDAPSQPNQPNPQNQTATASQSTPGQAGGASVTGKGGADKGSSSLQALLQSLTRNGAAAAPKQQLNGDAGQQKDLQQLLQVLGEKAQTTAGGSAGTSSAERLLAMDAALLAQAKSEFANELAQNLRRLKQVIQESQQIAQRMQAVIEAADGGGKKTNSKS